MQGTPRYIYTVILAYELIPGIFVFYNLITSVRVIMHLYVKQRKVSRALSEASHETRQLLTGSSDNAGSGFNSNTRRGSLSSKEVNQLKAVRKVYRACIRIALYPLTPLWWWVATAAFYWGQYPINLTFKWHIDAYIRLYLIAWTTFGSVVIMNFLVFSTDPSVLHVFSELKKDIAIKLNRRKTRGFQDTGSQEAIYKPKSRKDGVTITEHTDFGTVHGDSSSIETDGLKNYHIESSVVHHSPSMLEDGGSFTTAYASLEDDDVIRRARAGEDVTGFYDNM
ncbi:hypothetical protein LPJ56_001583 [Coemansia sp. RSA 2599]|nr:hypothetical protein LPJ75_001196 [Coemansia sp. RSA 2598]KAJ1827604.1 hypothetical protein LPJ56_001583 [Coemansia sp. RSA 2599]